MTPSSDQFQAPSILYLAAKLGQSLQCKSYKALDLIESKLQVLFVTPNDTCWNSVFDALVRVNHFVTFIIIFKLIGLLISILYSSDMVFPTESEDGLPRFDCDTQNISDHSSRWQSQKAVIGYNPAFSMTADINRTPGQRRATALVSL